MRLIKMFGLAAIGVAAFMAFVGATSAMAVTELEEVVVCKEKIDPCLVGGVSKAFPSGTKIDGELVTGTHATLLSNLGNILCNESNVAGETTTSLAHGKITSVTFLLNGGPCELTGLGNACEVTVERLPYLVLVNLTANHAAYEAIVSSGGTGAPRALADCGSSALKCFFGHPEVLFTVLLETHDTVWDVEQELNREGGSGFLCPTTSKWDAKYLTRCLEPAGTYKDCWPKME